MSAKVILTLVAALALAACDDGKPGTSVSINAGDGNMVAGVDGNGQVAINLPGGFAGKIKLPKMKLSAENFDMNGVHLFPGSTISGLNVDAGDKGDGAVRVQFSSPATPSTVRDWFLDKLSKQAGFTITASGNDLIGTTDEKQPFRLDLAPDGADKSKGTIVIG
ncbi:hypothetical protein [Sphingomonas sp. PB4P5]|uniref:hypothetical protein n=1 Tax=Parasphingomonas puruogangriensis TaxID=3096155 RepID=UPI002FC7CEB6